MPARQVVGFNYFCWYLWEQHLKTAYYIHKEIMTHIYVLLASKIVSAIAFRLFHAPRIVLVSHRGFLCHNCFAQYLLELSNLSAHLSKSNEIRCHWAYSNILFSKSCLVSQWILVIYYYFWSNATIYFCWCSSTRVCIHIALFRSFGLHYNGRLFCTFLVRRSSCSLCQTFLMRHCIHLLSYQQIQEPMAAQRLRISNFAQCCDSSGALSSTMV